MNEIQTPAMAISGSGVLGGFVLLVIVVTLFPG